MAQYSASHTGVVLLLLPSGGVLLLHSGGVLLLHSGGVLLLHSGGVWRRSLALGRSPTANGWRWPGQHSLHHLLARAGVENNLSLFSIEEQTEHGFPYAKHPMV